jgi:hypothetical protein
MKAEVNEILRQELLIQLWDYDGYFPGVQGDDFLGQLVHVVFILLKMNEQFSIAICYFKQVLFSVALNRLINLTVAQSFGLLKSS